MYKSMYTQMYHIRYMYYLYLSKISKDILRICLRTFEAEFPKIFKNVWPQSKNSTFL